MWTVFSRYEYHQLQNTQVLVATQYFVVKCVAFSACGWIESLHTHRLVLLLLSGYFLSRKFPLTAIKHLNMQHNPLMDNFSFCKSMLMKRSSCWLQEKPFGKCCIFPCVMLLC